MRNVKSVIIVFQIKMRQKHGLWLILIKLGYFFELQSDYFKNEVKNVKTVIIVFQLKMRQKHGLWVILIKLGKFFDCQ